MYVRVSTPAVASSRGREDPLRLRRSCHGRQRVPFDASHSELIVRPANFVSTTDEPLDGC